jgi:hypothetical protein
VGQQRARLRIRRLDFAVVQGRSYTHEELTCRIEDSSFRSVFAPGWEISHNRIGVARRSQLPSRPCIPDHRVIRDDVDEVLPHYDGVVNTTRKKYGCVRHTIVITVVKDDQATFLVDDSSSESHKDIPIGTYGHSSRRTEAVCKHCSTEAGR